MLAAVNIQMNVMCDENTVVDSVVLTTYCNMLLSLSPIELHV